MWIGVQAHNEYALSVGGVLEPWIYQTSSQIRDIDSDDVVTFAQDAGLTLLDDGDQWLTFTRTAA